MALVQLESDNVAYFDCDETLVYVDSIPEGCTQVWVQIPGFPGKYCGVHQTHVNRLKDHKIWGNGVVVWSRSGYQWAKAVVTALELTEHVDVVLSKPLYFYDDKRCDQILGEHRFLSNED